MRGNFLAKIQGRFLAGFYYLRAGLFLSLIALNFSCSSGNLRRAQVMQNFEKEDDSLDFIIKHSIPVISLEAPKDRETFKKKLKLWNPHIRDWTSVGGWENINVYHKSPLWEVALGYHYYDNEEKLAEGGVITTSNSGPTLDLRATWVHDLSIFSYLNYKLLQKNDFTVENQEKIYSFPVNHSLEYGWRYQSPFSPIGFNLALGWEQYSFISFNSDRFRIKAIIEQNLQVSTSEIFWLLPSLDFRFSVYGKGGYIRLGAGVSALGKKELDDGAKSEDVSSFRGIFSYKQFIHSRWWIQTYMQYANLSGETESTQGQYGLYLGYSL